MIGSLTVRVIAAKADHAKVDGAPLDTEFPILLSNTAANEEDTKCTDITNLAFITVVLLTTFTREVPF